MNRTEGAGLSAPKPGPRTPYAARRYARPPIAALAVLLLCVSGCATIHVQTDYDPAADFTRLRTYAWQPRPERADGDPRINNDLVDARVRTAVDRVLQARGYQAAVDAPPDFQVAYIVTIDTRTDIHAIPVSYGWGWWGTVGTETYVDTYEQGTLLLDIIDAGSNKLIWRGSAAARVIGDSSPAERTQRVNKAVEKILERFPPPR